MPAITLHHGNPLMVDHTPSGADQNAGTVISVGQYTQIVHTKILDGKLGAAAAQGGVYKGVADAAITAGDKVYWDAGAAKVTTTAAAGANDHLGYALTTTAADGDAIFVVHQPDGSAI